MKNCCFISVSIQSRQCQLISKAIYSQVGERIRVILDCEDNTLAFEKNYEFLGKEILLNVYRCC